MRLSVVASGLARMLRIVSTTATGSAYFTGKASRTRQSARMAQQAAVVGPLIGAHVARCERKWVSAVRCERGKRCAFRACATHGVLHFYSE